MQGKCIACLPRPPKTFDWRFAIYDLAGRCGAAPHKLSFGDSAARWRAACLEIGNHQSQIVNGMVRLPGIAPGHAPWRGAILAVKLQPRKLKGPRTSSHPRPMPFQQRTNTSCYLAIPTHGFTVVLSVFRGTPPIKPLNCKSVSNRLGARIRPGWAHHTGGTPKHSCA